MNDLSSGILLFFVVCWSVTNYFSCVHAVHGEKLLVLTVIKRETSGYRRFLHSAQVTGLTVKALGLGGYWDGDGNKVIKLKEELEHYKDDPEQVILFANSADALLTAGAEQILNKFKKFNSKIVFSAEKNCWPEWALASKYPTTTMSQKFLNSGLFIGYAPELYRVVSHSTITPYLNDQLYYSRIYVDEKLRNEFSISLDHKSELFLNLYMSTQDVKLGFDELTEEMYALFIPEETRPVAFHANGLTHGFLNYLANYVPNAWSPEKGCLICLEDPKSLSGLKPEDHPTVIVALFIEQPTPSLDEFFLRIYDLNYPKQKIHLIIHNTVQLHTDLVDGFAEDSIDEYGSIQIIGPENKMKEWRARDFAVQECVAQKCDYLFGVDSDAHLENPEVLYQLIEQNRTVIAPMLHLASNNSVINFWGSVRSDGTHDPTIDYLDVVLNHHRGLWQVPYVSSSVLVRGDVIHDPKTRPFYVQVPHLAFCAGMRDRHIDMFVSNREDWGHLISTANFEPSVEQKAYKSTGKARVKRGHLLHSIIHSLGFYIIMLVVVLSLYKILRKHLLCNPRIVRIVLSRNISSIWDFTR